MFYALIFSAVRMNFLCFGRLFKYVIFICSRKDGFSCQYVFSGIISTENGVSLVGIEFRGIDLSYTNLEMPRFCGDNFSILIFCIYWLYYTNENDNLYLCNVWKFPNASLFETVHRPSMETKYGLSNVVHFRFLKVNLFIFSIADV